MEPTTGLATLAVAYIGKDGIEKLLGPTAEYFGEGLKGIVEKRFKNLNSILQRAQRKLGARIQAPGTVPPRVFKEILYEATFNEDNISLEYFSGILASSRTPDGRDDRGVRISKLISRMSTYQIRGHYVLYSALVQSYIYSGKKITKIDDRKAMPVYIQLSRFAAAMNIADHEQASDLLSHTLHGLLDDGLLDSWLMGSSDVLRKKFPNAPVKDGIVFKPSLAGAELFSAALGKGDASVNLLLQEEVDAAAFEAEIVVSGVQALSS